MSRRLDDVRLAVLMLDEIELKGRTNVVALGITTEGQKIPLGLWEGFSENAAVATALLSDLVDRGLDTAQGVLCVLDGAKALRRAVRDVLGEVTPVGRCVRHKERNVLDHLPERDRAAVKRRLRRAREREDHVRAEQELRLLASELERSHPGAAASLLEGLAETLTVTRLGVRGQLRRTLASTNPCESMIECVRRTSRNVKRWSSGEMCLRWTAAGMLEAERELEHQRHRRGGPPSSARCRTRQRHELPVWRDAGRHRYRIGGRGTALDANVPDMSEETFVGVARVAPPQALDRARPASAGVSAATKLRSRGRELD